MSKKNSSANLKKDLRYSKAFNEVYSSFKKKLNTIQKKSYVIAVSGGPDSLALVSLSKIYAVENKVKFYFEPTSLKYGSYIQITSIIILIGLIFLSLKKIFLTK